MSSSRLCKIEEQGSFRDEQVEQSLRGASGGFSEGLKKLMKVGLRNAKNKALGRERNSAAGGASPDATNKTMNRSMSLFEGRADGIVHNKFTLGKVLGKGAFGTVQLAVDKETGVEYACKVVPLSCDGGVFHVEAAMKEADILLHVRGHPNILKIHSFFEDDDNLYVVQELCMGGDLVAAVMTTTLTEAVVARIMRTMLEAIAHCHALGVIHRDIKLDNFLLSTNDKELAVNIRLADFGCSEFTNEEKLLSEPAGSHSYMAPEVYDGMYSFPADIWSCGIVMYAMISGRFPFTMHKGDSNKSADAVASETVDVESGTWRSISKEAKEFVLALLTKDPAMRPTAVSALGMKWFHSEGVGRNEVIERPVRLRLKEFAAMTRFKQEVMRLVAHLMDEGAKTGHKNMFEAASGGEHRIKLEAALNSLRARSMPEAEIDMVKLHFRLDDEGYLSLIEYIAMVAASTSGVKTAGVLEQVYNMFDPLGSGFITADSVMELLKSSDREAVVQVLDEAGAKDGQMSEDQFYRCILGGPKPQPIQMPAASNVVGKRSSLLDPRRLLPNAGDTNCTIM